MKDLLEFAKARSDFGSQKYRIDSPGHGPWGDDPTIELFWFRNLPEDMREELADAQVYSERLTVRVCATDMSDEARNEFKRQIEMYEYAISVAYRITHQITDVLETYAPDLLTDQEEMWGNHSPRLTLAE